MPATRSLPDPVSRAWPAPTPEQLRLTKIEEEINASPGRPAKFYPEKKS